MAEAIARAVVSARGATDIEVSSAGTSAWEGAPASDGALLVSMEHGLDLNAHRARVLSPEILERADVVLVMGPHHQERAHALGGAGRTHLLTHFASAGASRVPVGDPFGGDLDAYRATFRELDEAVRQVVDRVLAERSG